MLGEYATEIVSARLAVESSVRHSLWIPHLDSTAGAISPRESQEAYRAGTSHEAPENDPIIRFVISCHLIVLTRDVLGPTSGVWSIVLTILQEAQVGEGLRDLEQQVPLVHARDVILEPEALHDLAHVGREGVDVLAEVLRDLVRIVEQPREIEPGRVVERPPPGGRLKQLPAHVGAVARCTPRRPRARPPLSRPGRSRSAGAR